MSDLLTIAQAAERRGCTAAAIRLAVKDGRLPPYDQGGVRYVWADDVDLMDAPRNVNTSSGEPVLRADEVPGDDEAIRKGFDLREIRLLSYALDFAFLRGRLHAREKPIVDRLRRRFYRMARGGDESAQPPPDEPHDPRISSLWLISRPAS